MNPSINFTQMVSQHTVHNTVQNPVQNPVFTNLANIFLRYTRKYLKEECLSAIGIPFMEHIDHKTKWTDMTLCHLTSMCP